MRGGGDDLGAVGVGVVDVIGRGACRGRHHSHIGDTASLPQTLNPKS